MRKQFLTAVILIPALILLLALVYPPILWTFVVIAPLAVLGLHDYLQTNHAVKRNFPLIGRFRYLFEAIRPEIYQYFVTTKPLAKRE